MEGHGNYASGTERTLTQKLKMKEIESLKKYAGLVEKEGKGIILPPPLQKKIRSKRGRKQVYIRC